MTNFAKEVTALVEEAAETIEALRVENELLKQRNAILEPIVKRVSEVAFEEGYVGVETPNVRVYVPRWVILKAREANPPLKCECEKGDFSQSLFCKNCGGCLY